MSAVVILWMLSLAWGAATVDCLKHGSDAAPVCFVLSIGCASGAALAFGTMS